MRKIGRFHDTFKCLTQNCSLLNAKSSSSVMSQKSYYCSSSADKEQKTPPAPPHEWRKPWSEVQGEWYSSFKYFESSNRNAADIFRFMQQDINLGPSAIRKWLKRKEESGKLLDQSYIPERHQILGNNLATAHFIVHRKGAVRFVGSPHWLRMDEEGNYKLPPKYVPNVFVDAVDASNMDLQFEGLANIVGLKKLSTLILKNCKYIDDWCLDQITGEHDKSLEFLDISECPRITERGLTVLHRLKNLRELKVEGTVNSVSTKLVCLMLEELNPKLNIIGVHHEEHTQPSL